MISNFRKKMCITLKALPNAKENVFLFNHSRLLWMTLSSIELVGSIFIRQKCLKRKKKAKDEREQWMNS